MEIGWDVGVLGEEVSECSHGESRESAAEASSLSEAIFGDLCDSVGEFGSALATRDLADEGFAEVVFSGDSGVCHFAGADVCDELIVVVVIVFDVTHGCLLRF